MRPRRNPPDTIDVGGSPQGVAIANGSVWVTVQNAVHELPGAAAAAGTVRVTAENDVDFMDPALAYSAHAWQLLFATCAKLLTYPDKPAPAGSQLVPEVARSLPQRSADGKTYTFTIREGFRFSPPSNEPVTARTFKYTIERSLSPKMKGPAHFQGYLSNVVGAKAYMAGKAPHISGDRCAGRQADGPTRGARAGFRDSHRVTVLLRGADRDSCRPQGDPARSIRGAVLRRDLHPRARSRAQTQSQLPRQSPASTEPHRARSWRLQRQGGARDRGREGGLRRGRCWP